MVSSPHAWLLVVTVHGVGGRVSGGYSVGETPGPIPNPVAKTHSADGTALGRVWESKTPPKFTSVEGMHTHG